MVRQGPDPGGHDSRQALRERANRHAKQSPHRSESGQQRQGVAAGKFVSQKRPISASRLAVAGQVGKQVPEAAVGINDGMLVCGVSIYNAAPAAVKPAKSQAPAAVIPPPAIPPHPLGADSASSILTVAFVPTLGPLVAVAPGSAMPAKPSGPAAYGAAAKSGRLPVARGSSHKRMLATYAPTWLGPLAPKPPALGGNKGAASRQYNTQATATGGGGHTQLGKAAGVGRPLASQSPQTQAGGPVGDPSHAVSAAELAAPADLRPLRMRAPASAAGSSKATAALGRTSSLPQTQLQRAARPAAAMRVQHDARRGWSYLDTIYSANGEGSPGPQQDCQHHAQAYGQSYLQQQACCNGSAMYASVYMQHGQHAARCPETPMGLSAEPSYASNHSYSSYAGASPYDIRSRQGSVASWCSGYAPPYIMEEHAEHAGYDDEGHEGQENWGWLRERSIPLSPHGSESLHQLMGDITPRFAVARPPNYIPTTPSSLGSTCYQRSDIFSLYSPLASLRNAAAAHGHSGYFQHHQAYSHSNTHGSGYYPGGGGAPLHMLLLRGAFGAGPGPGSSRPSPSGSQQSAQTPTRAHLPPLPSSGPSGLARVHSKFTPMGTRARGPVDALLGCPSPRWTPGSARHTPLQGHDSAPAGAAGSHSHVPWSSTSILQRCESDAGVVSLHAAMIHATSPAGSESSSPVAFASQRQLQSLRPGAASGLSPAYGPTPCKPSRFFKQAYADQQQLQPIHQQKLFAVEDEEHHHGLGLLSAAPSPPPYQCHGHDGMDIGSESSAAPLKVQQAAQLAAAGALVALPNIPTCPIVLSAVPVAVQSAVQQPQEEALSGTVVFGSCSPTRQPRATPVRATRGRLEAAEGAVAAAADAAAAKATLLLQAYRQDEAQQQQQAAPKVQASNSRMLIRLHASCGQHASSFTHGSGASSGVSLHRSNTCSSSTGSAGRFTESGKTLSSGSASGSVCKNTGSSAGSPSSAGTQAVSLLWEPPPAPPAMPAWVQQRLKATCASNSTSFSSAVPGCGGPRSRACSLASIPSAFWRAGSAVATADWQAAQIPPPPPPPPLTQQVKASRAASANRPPRQRWALPDKSHAQGATPQPPIQAWSDQTAVLQQYSSPSRPSVRGNSTGARGQDSSRQQGTAEQGALRCKGSSPLSNARQAHAFSASPAPQQPGMHQHCRRTRSVSAAAALSPRPIGTVRHSPSQLQHSLRAYSASPDLTVGAHSSAAMSTCALATLAPNGPRVRTPPPPSQHTVSACTHGSHPGPGHVNQAAAGTGPGMVFSFGIGKLKAGNAARGCRHGQEDIATARLTAGPSAPMTNTSRQQFEALLPAPQFAGCVPSQPRQRWQVAQSVNVAAGVTLPSFMPEPGLQASICKAAHAAAAAAVTGGGAQRSVSGRRQWSLPRPMSATGTQQHVLPNVVDTPQARDIMWGTMRHSALLQHVQSPASGSTQMGVHGNRPTSAVQSVNQLSSPVLRYSRHLSSREDADSARRAAADSDCCSGGGTSSCGGGTSSDAIGGISSDAISGSAYSSVMDDACSGSVSPSQCISHIRQSALATPVSGTTPKDPGACPSHHMPEQAMQKSAVPASRSRPAVWLHAREHAQASPAAMCGNGIGHSSANSNGGGSSVQFDTQRNLYGAFQHQASSENLHELLQPHTISNSRGSKGSRKSRGLAPTHSAGSRPAQFTPPRPPSAAAAAYDRMHAAPAFTPAAAGVGSCSKAQQQTRSPALPPRAQAAARSAASPYAAGQGVYKAAAGPGNSRAADKGAAFSPAGPAAAATAAAVRHHVRHGGIMSPAGGTYGAAAAARPDPGYVPAGQAAAAPAVKTSSVLARHVSVPPQGAAPVHRGPTPPHMQASHASHSLARAYAPYVLHRGKPNPSPCSPSLAPLPPAARQSQPPAGQRVHGEVVAVACERSLWRGNSDAAAAVHAARHARALPPHGPAGPPSDKSHWSYRRNAARAHVLHKVLALAVGTSDALAV